MTETTDATDSRDREIQYLKAQLVAMIEVRNKWMAFAEKCQQNLACIRSSHCGLRSTVNQQVAEIARLKRQQALILAHYRGRLADAEKRRQVETDLLRRQLGRMQAAFDRAVEEAVGLQREVWRLQAQAIWERTRVES